MMKYVFVFLGIALAVAITALCLHARKTAPDVKAKRFHVVVLVLALLLALNCALPAFMPNNSAERRTVVYLGKTSMTLVDENSGKATEVPLDKIFYDKEIAKGDEVIVVENMFGVIQYVDKFEKAAITE